MVLHQRRQPRAPNARPDLRTRERDVGCPRDGTLSLEDADATIQGEIEFGNLGHALARAGDTNGDGLADLLIGAPLTDAEGQRSGRAWLFSGPLEGTYVASDADATFLSAGELDWTGYDVESAGDVNNDGFDDIILGAPGAGASAGVAYVYYGSSTGPSTTADVSSARMRWTS